MPVVSVVLAGFNDAITCGNPIRFADSVHTNNNPRTDFEFTHFGPPIRGSADTVCGYSAFVCTIGPGADWGGKVARELLSDRPTQYTARSPLSTRRASHSIHC